MGGELRHGLTFEAGQTNDNAKRDGGLRQVSTTVQKDDGV